VAPGPPPFFNRRIGADKLRVHLLELSEWSKTLSLEEAKDLSEAVDNYIGSLGLQFDESIDHTVRGTLMRYLAPPFKDAPRSTLEYIDHLYSHANWDPSLLLVVAEESIGRPALYGLDLLKLEEIASVVVAVSQVLTVLGACLGGAEKVFRVDANYLFTYQLELCANQLQVQLSHAALRSRLQTAKSKISKYLWQLSSNQHEVTTRPGSALSVASSTASRRAEYGKYQDVRDAIGYMSARPEYQALLSVETRGELDEFRRIQNENQVKLREAVSQIQSDLEEQKRKAAGKARADLPAQPEPFLAAGNNYAPPGYERLNIPRPLPATARPLDWGVDQSRRRAAEQLAQVKRNVPQDLANIFLQGDLSGHMPNAGYIPSFATLQAQSSAYAGGPLFSQNAANAGSISAFGRAPLVPSTPLNANAVTAANWAEGILT
jgi:hypothetical protein